jgi:hypothetical protein
VVPENVIRPDTFDTWRGLGPVLGFAAIVAAAVLAGSSAPRVDETPAATARVEPSAASQLIADLAAF